MRGTPLVLPVHVHMCQCPFPLTPALHPSGCALAGIEQSSWRALRLSCLTHWMFLKCTPHLLLRLDKREHTAQSKLKVLFSHSPAKYPELSPLYESQLPTIGRRIELHTQAWKEPGPR